MIKPALAIMLFAAMPLVAISQQHNPNEIPTNLAGVTTVTAPPEGFNAREASDEDLRYYGFPPRPNEADEPDAYASWARAMAASKHRITPKLEPMRNSHGPAHSHAKNDAAGEQYGPLVDPNWSGYVVTGSAKEYGKPSFTEVYSHMMVPVASQAYGACNGGWDYAASWVGMDGFKSESLLQAGFEFDAYCNGSSTLTNYSPWYEWYPNNPVSVTNLTISPGDDFWVYVWNTSATQGYAYFVNFDTGLATEIGITAPAGYPLIGNSVEWITERPGSNTLTNYVDSPFWESYAYSPEKHSVDPGDGKAIVMTDNNGHDISFPTLLGSTAFLMQDEGSATE